MVKFVKPKLVFTDDTGGSGLDWTLGNNIPITDIDPTKTGNGYTYAYLAEASDVKTLLGLPADFDDWNTFNARLDGSPHLTYAGMHSALAGSGYDPVSYLSIYEDEEGSLYVRFAWGLADPKGMVFGDKWSGNIEFVKGDNVIEVKNFEVIGTSGDCDPEIPDDDYDPEPGDGWFSAQDDYVHGLNVKENVDGTLDITKNGSSTILSANVLMNDVDKDADGNFRISAAPIVSGTFDIFGGSIKTPAGDLYFTEDEAEQIFSFTQHTTGNVTVRLDTNALNDVITARNTDTNPDNDIHVSGADFRIEAFYNAKGFGSQEFDTGEGADINGNADTYAGGKVIFDGTMTTPEGYFEAFNDGADSDNVQGANQMGGKLDEATHTFNEIYFPDAKDVMVGIKVFNNDVASYGGQDHKSDTVGVVIENNTIRITDENGGSKIICGGVDFYLGLADAEKIFVVNNNTQTIGINREELNKYIIDHNAEFPNNKIDPGLADSGGNNIANFTLVAQYNAVGNWDNHDLGEDVLDSHGAEGAKVTFKIPRITVEPSTVEVEAFDDYISDTSNFGEAIFDPEGNIIEIRINHLNADGTTTTLNAADGYDVTLNDAVKDLATGTIYTQVESPSLITAPTVSENHIESITLTGGFLTLNDMTDPATQDFYKIELTANDAAQIFNIVDNKKIAINLDGFKEFLSNKGISNLHGDVRLSAQYNAVSEGVTDTLLKNNLVYNNNESNALTSVTGEAGATAVYLFNVNSELSPIQENNYSVGFVTDENTNIDEINSDDNSDNAVNEDSDGISQDSYDNLFEVLDQLEATASGNASLLSMINNLKSTLNSSVANLASSNQAASATATNLSSAGSLVTDAPVFKSAPGNTSLAAASGSNPSTPPVAIEEPTVVSTLIENRTISLDATTQNGTVIHLPKLTIGYHINPDGTLTAAGATALNFYTDTYTNVHTTDLKYKTTLSDGTSTTKNADKSFSSSSYSAGDDIDGSAQNETAFSITTDGQVTYQDSNGITHSAGIIGSSALGSLASTASSNQSSSSSATANGTDLLGDREIETPGGHITGASLLEDGTIVIREFRDICGDLACPPGSVINDVINQLLGGSSGSGAQNSMYQPSYEPAYEPMPSYTEADQVPNFDAFHF